MFGPADPRILSKIDGVQYTSANPAFSLHPLISWRRPLTRVLDMTIFFSGFHPTSFSRSVGDPPLSLCIQASDSSVYQAPSPTTWKVKSHCYPCELLSFVYVLVESSLDIPSVSYILLVQLVKCVKEYMWMTTSRSQPTRSWVLHIIVLHRIN